MDPINIIVNASGNASQQLEQVGNSLGIVGKIAGGVLVAGLATATAAFSGIAAAMKIGLDSTMQWGAQLDYLGDQFGMSGEKASAFTVLANKVGLSVDEMGMGLNNFTRQLDDMNKQTKKGEQQITPFSSAIKKLGVNVYDSRGKMKSFDQLLPDLMDKFNKLPAGVNASSLAMDLFGARGGSKFLDFLRQGSAGLEDATRLAKELGLEMSTDTVNAIEELGFAQNQLNLAFTGFKNQIGIAVLPAFRELVDFINTNIAPVLVTWAKENIPAIAQSLRSLGATILTDVVPRLVALQAWVSSVVDVFKRDLLPKLAELRDRFVEYWPQIQASVTNAWANIQPVLAEFKTWLESDGIQSLETFYREMGLLKSAGDEWRGVLNQMLGDMKSFTTGVTGDASIELPKLAEITGWVMEAMRSRLTGGTATLRGVMLAWQGLTELDFQKFAVGIRGVFSGLFTQLFATVGLNFPALENQFRGWMQNIINTITGIDWVGIGASIIGNLAAGVSSSAWQIRDSITSAFSGLNLGGFRLPNFDMGGIVPGPIGQPVLAVVHGGETINRVGNASLGRGNAGNTIVKVYIGNQELRGIVRSEIIADDYRS